MNCNGKLNKFFEIIPLLLKIKILSVHCILVSFSCPKKTLSQYSASVLDHLG